MFFFNVPRVNMCVLQAHQIEKYRLDIVSFLYPNITPPNERITREDIKFSV